MNESSGLASRRDFLKTTAAAGGLAALSAHPLWGQEKMSLKLGVIGCGGRGSGATANCLEAARLLGIDLQVTALCDAYEDRLAEVGKYCKVPREGIFLGFNGYKKLLATDVDIVILATPPVFRPVHVLAAIQAGKHVFMEKPVAVDPPGCRKVIEAGELAKQKKLSIVMGAQRRHSMVYRKTAKAIREGVIGKILGGTVSWCGLALWKKERQPEWSDADYLVRNWVSFAGMSGDHIVEQHVHNIDVMNWYMGTHPVSALGFGMRARRKTGDMYDFFSVDYEFSDGVHIHSMCRQINDTIGNISERLMGEKGIAIGVEPQDPKVFPEGCKVVKDNYVQEHIDLLFGIQKGELLNEAESIAISTATAIMGRTAAYTGKKITWKDIMEPGGKYYDMTMKPAPEDFEKGDVKAPPDDVVPIPGKA